MQKEVPKGSYSWLYRKHDFQASFALTNPTTMVAECQGLMVFILFCLHISHMFNITWTNLTCFIKRNLPNCHTTKCLFPTQGKQPAAEKHCFPKLCKSSATFFLFHSPAPVLQYHMLAILVNSFKDKEPKFIPNANSFSLHLLRNSTQNCRQHPSGSRYYQSQGMH